jgi:Zn-dependent protease
MDDLEDLLFSRLAGFIPVLLSLAVHEWAHARTALRLGDDTAARLGRVTLNPFAHVDPIGTLLLPLLGFPFGWAKPVPVNPVRFRRGIRMGWGLLLVAAAGPAVNVCLAAGAAAGLLALGGGPPSAGADPLTAFLWSMVLINVVLAVFNMLPVPPLDGSRIADALMPRRWRPAWDRFAQVAPVLLLIAIFVPYLAGAGIFDGIEDGLRSLFAGLSR